MNLINKISILVLQRDFQQNKDCNVFPVVRFRKACMGCRGTSSKTRTATVLYYGKKLCFAVLQRDFQQNKDCNMLPKTVLWLPVPLQRDFQQNKDCNLPTLTAPLLPMYSCIGTSSKIRTATNRSVVRARIRPRLHRDFQQNKAYKLVRVHL